MRPLLVIDGDSLAHRAYHAMPKTIRLNGVLGFANMVSRLWEAEQPRAVLVAWDNLEVPTYRHRMFPQYQSGRTFDDALIEQLALLPEFVAACGFANAKAPLTRISNQKPTWRKAAALAREWQLKQLAERLEDLELEHLSRR